MDRSLTVAAPGELPKITVVTPNRNGAATLRETLDSVLQQDYPDLEYIVVDGGSTDESHAILDEYRPRLAHILVGTDRTLYDGIAKGFDRASGEVLAWLNSDDMYEPGILRRVGRVFARRPGWDVIYFDGTVWKQGWRVPNRPQRRIGLPELLAGHMLYQECVFFRRRAYEAVGGLAREGFHLAGDYELWLRLAARYRFHYIAEHAGCFRLRPGQLSANWPAYHAEMVRARERLAKQLPRWFALRAWPGRWARKLINRAGARRRAALPCLSNEHSDWGTMAEPPPLPLQQCRCPGCGEQPRRLLGSTPDMVGERGALAPRVNHGQLHLFSGGLRPPLAESSTVRRVYHCHGCQAAFFFPPRRIH